MSRDPATCAPEDSLNRAAQLMWEERCSCLPVVDRDGHVVGLVTERDICMGAYTQGRRLTEITVETAMSRPAPTCAPTTTVEDAENVMRTEDVRRLVVVDADGRLRGIVTRAA
jgi:CBS domain-containing protein